jgi:hypothetical protein
MPEADQKYTFLDLIWCCQVKRRWAVEAGQSGPATCLASAAVIRNCQEAREQLSSPHGHFAIGRLQNVQGQYLPLRVYTLSPSRVLGTLNHGYNQLVQAMDGLGFYPRHSGCVTYQQVQHVVQQAAGKAYSRYCDTRDI